MKKIVDFIKPAAILLLVAAVVALVLGGVGKKAKKEDAKA